MDMIERFKKFYNEDFKDKVYDAATCDAVLREWGTFRTKIADGTFSLEDYTNRASNTKDYLIYFLERNSTVFGWSRGGTSFQYMVKMNDDGNTFYLQKIGNNPKNEKADRTTANTYFEANVKPLFEKLISCNSMSDIIALENEKLFKNYQARQILFKVLILESKYKATDYQYLLFHIYKNEVIEFAYETFECQGGITQIQKNYFAMKKAYEVLGLNVSQPDAKTSFEIHCAFWKLFDTQKDYILECVSNNKLTKIILDSFNEHKQIVLTGAPGTGKTYSATQLAKELTDKFEGAMEFVQFHPSYDYSDFVEGLRPVVLSTSVNSKPTFVKVDGVFKEFCRKIVMDNYDNMKNRHNVEPNDFFEFYKTYEAEENIRYFFIIDEINRADLSKVFGELMYGLEESYRGIENSFNTQYQNLKTYEVKSDGKAYKLDFDCFERGFFIPKNLYIIGTMNDIDKSVESFDFALRRRFEWIEIKAKDVIYDALPQIVSKGGKNQVKNLADKINAMNDIISTEGRDFGLSEAYHIGHSYFKGVDASDMSTVEYVFDHNISSILKEYTRGRDKTSVEIFIGHCKDALMGK